MKKQTVQTVHTYLDGVCLPNQKIIINSSNSVTLHFIKNIPTDVYDKYITDICNHRDHIDNMIVNFNGFTRKNNKYMETMVDLSYIPSSSDVSMIFNKLHLIMKSYIISLKTKLLDYEYDEIISEYDNLCGEVESPKFDKDETNNNTIENYFEYLTSDKGINALINDILR